MPGVGADDKKGEMKKVSTDPLFATKELEKDVGVKKIIGETAAPKKEVPVAKKDAIPEFAKNKPI